MHAQSCRFAGLGWRREGFHAVSPHENSAVADVEEYTKGRDVVNHADDRNEVEDVFARQRSFALSALASISRRRGPAIEIFVRAEAPESSSLPDRESPASVLLSGWRNSSPWRRCIPAQIASAR